MKKLDEVYVKDKFRTLGAGWWEPEEHASLGAARASQREYLIGLVQPASKMALDAATGKGRFAIALAANGAKEVWAVDISRDMLLEAKGRAHRANEHAPIRFVIGDIERLPFPSGHFDLALCMETFVHLPMPSRAVSELVRVTKRGGVLAADVRLHEVDLDRFWNYPRHLLRQLRKTWWDQRIPAKYKAIHRYMTASEFTSLFSRSGIKILEVRNWGPPTYNLLVIASKEL